jgi:uncharacterized HAD superfamily protein
METKKEAITISSFDEIKLTAPNPLILCDIDETFFTFKRTYKFFYKIIKKRNPLLSPTEINSIANRAYNKYAKKCKPYIYDKEGFVNMYKKVNDLSGEIMFVTARKKTSEKYTRNQFKTNLVNYDHFKFHYTSRKGEYIKNCINKHGKGEIVFIDDQDRFIHDVKEKNPFITCYKFNCR